MVSRVEVLVPRGSTGTRRGSSVTVRQRIVDGWSDVWYDVLGLGFVVWAFEVLDTLSTDL